MASLHCPGELELDYSMWDGSVRFLELNGKVLVDEDTEKDGWRQKLWEWAEERGMTVNDGQGWRAWVIRLSQELDKPLHKAQ